MRTRTTYVLICVALALVTLFACVLLLPAALVQWRQIVAPQPPASTTPAVAVATPNEVVVPEPTNAPEPEATKAPEPTAAPATDEITCEHKNAGEFDLEPGYSINGGHVYVNGQEYLYVDGKVVVVTNHSNQAVKVNSTDGVGLCNSAEFRGQVIVRFAEGCGPSGCKAVKHVDITKQGTTVTVYEKAKYCPEHKDEVYCK